MVEGRGFLNVTLTPDARVSLVYAVGDGAAYLTGGQSGTGAKKGEQGEASGGGRAGGGRGHRPVWALSALHEAPTVEEARELARGDARRRIVHAREVAHAGGIGGTYGDTPARATSSAARSASASEAVRIPEVSWRDPYLDAQRPYGPVARLLAVTGEASARVAFCRSIPERPRRGEETGAGLPALPTAENPGNWARHTDANPAFLVRYAHAHAVATLAWAHASGWNVPALPARSLPTGSRSAPSSSAGGAESPRPSTASDRRTEPLVQVRLEPNALGDSPAPAGQLPAATSGHPASGHSDPSATIDLTPAAVAALDEPAAAALIGVLFDGPGVLATAGRRREPHTLVRYLEGLAIAYHEWRESRGAVIGDVIGPETGGGTCGEGIAARLELCAAAAGVLRTGLSLLGVSAPTRL
nr:DALR anticodon-binding domain-containing protein [Nocardiopsis gilva]